MNRSLPGVAAAAVFPVLLLAGCMTAGAPPAVPSPAATASGAYSVPAPDASSIVLASPPPGVTQPASSPPPVVHPVTRYPSGWTLPDRKLSPGATQPGYTIRDICPHVNPALEAMRPSTSDKARVYAAYGITHHAAGQYEIDHVDAIELVGLVDAPVSWPSENLYPELNDTPDPAMLARYGLSPAFVHNSKDILEDVLHKDVCAGTVSLSAAQHAIMTDWRAAYAKYVGKPPSGSTPVSSPSRTYRSSSAPQPTRSAKIFSSAPAHAACYPRTSGGNCYRAGEFCRSSDHGASGIAGNGERITCALNGTRWRWEPA